MAQLTRTEAKQKVRILCVDDEQNVLEGITLHLGRRYEVQTATSGAAALELLEKDGGRAVILSDMRMPGMDGATFLARARSVAPNAVRMLLTGQADIESAISAVNDGQIFRFLTKPCPPPALLAAFGAAVDQHNLIVAEKVLLEQTLHGCIKALTDVLALTNPAAFGRATRIKQLVVEMADKRQVQGRWQVEVAAMLSQLGHITLLPETAERVYFNQPLSIEEEKQLAHLPAVTEQLIANIPRMEAVREILASYTAPPRRDLSAAESSDPQRQLVRRGAGLLKVAVDFDALESHKNSAELAIETMAKRSGVYGPEALEALGALTATRGRGRHAGELRDLAPNELCEGMLLAEDVVLANGMMLVARGHEVTLKFIERVRQLPKGSLKSTLRVLVPWRGAAS